MFKREQLSQAGHAPQEPADSRPLLTNGPKPEVQQTGAWADAVCSEESDCRRGMRFINTYPRSFVLKIA